MKPAIILACLLVAAFRPVLLLYDFNSHVEVGYQAVAHLLVGGLAGAWLMHRHVTDCVQEFANATQRQVVLLCETRTQLAFGFWALTAVEVLCAGITIARKFA